MREIKFKAWHKRWKVMSNAYSLWNIDYIRDDFERKAQRRDSYGENDIVYLQYTGLKDVNGNEIYEGDIVKTNIDGYTVKALVIWYIDGFMLKVLNFPEHSGISKETLFGLPRRGDAIMVVGNIFENPELLNETKNQSKEVN